MQMNKAPLGSVRFTLLVSGTFLLFFSTVFAIGNNRETRDNRIGQQQKADSHGTTRNLSASRVLHQSKHASRSRSYYQPKNKLVKTCQTKKAESVGKKYLKSRSQKSETQPETTTISREKVQEYIDRGETIGPCVTSSTLYASILHEILFGEIPVDDNGDAVVPLYYSLGIWNLDLGESTFEAGTYGSVTLDTFEIISDWDTILGDIEQDKNNMDAIQWMEDNDFQATAIYGGLSAASSYQEAVALVVTMPDPANLTPDGGTVSLLLVIHDDPSYYGYFLPGQSSRQLLTLPPPEEVLPRPVDVCSDLVEVPLEKTKCPKNQPTKLVDEACAEARKEECRERATAVVDAAAKEWRDAQELNKINNEIGLVGTIGGFVLSLALCALLGVGTAGVGFVPCIVGEMVVSQTISQSLEAINDGVLLNFADATTTFVQGEVEVIRSDTLVDIKEQCIQCKPLCPAGQKPCLDGPCIPEGDCCLPEDLRCNPGPCRDPYSCCGGDEAFCVDRCLDATNNVECPFTENRICVDVGQCCPGLQKKCGNSCINSYECCPSDSDCSSNEICGEVATASGTEFVCSTCDEGYEPNNDATQCIREQCPGELVTCPDGQCSFTADQCFPFCGDGECDVSEETVENCRQDCFVGPFFCGDGFCDVGLGENINECELDCGDCPQGSLTCPTGICVFEAQSCPTCGDAFCDTDSQENADNCELDCGGCPAGSITCPTGICAFDVQSCPECGDGECDSFGLETTTNCPQDCISPPLCGDGNCEEDRGETVANCIADCGSNCPGQKYCLESQSCVSADACCPNEQQCGDGSCIWIGYCCPEDRYCDPVEIAQPPVVRGDPQLMTFFGFRYECQGEGEFVLLKSLDSTFQIQARFRSVGTNGMASVTTGIAIQDEGYPTIQLSLAEHADSNVVMINSCPLQIYIDGILQTSMTEVALGGGVDVDNGRVRIQASRWGRIQYPEHRLSLNFGIDSSTNFGCFLFGESLDYPIRYGGAVTPRPGYRSGERLYGLFGSPYSSQIFFTREGEALQLTDLSPEATYNYCTSQFCLQSEDDSIFTYEDGMSFDDFSNCNAPFLPIDLGSASPEVLNLCGRDVSCLTDGVVGGFDAAMLTLEAQLAEDTQRGSSSALRFDPAVIPAFTDAPTVVTVTVELLSVVEGLIGFSLYDVNPETLIQGTQALSFLSPAGSGSSNGIVVGAVDLVYSGEVQLTSNLAGDVFAFRVVPIIGELEINSSSLVMTAWSAVRSYSPVLISSPQPSSLPMPSSYQSPVPTYSFPPSTSPTVMLR